MKIISEYLQQTEYLQWIALLPLVIFLLLFLMVSIHAFLIDKRSVDTWSRMPMDDEKADDDAVTQGKRVS